MPEYGFAGSRPGEAAIVRRAYRSRKLGATACDPWREGRTGRNGGSAAAPKPIFGALDGFWSGTYISESGRTGPIGSAPAIPSG
jgi:hypothetical protein